MSADDPSSLNPEPPAKKGRKAKAYVPSLRSGPYALILALSSLPQGQSAGLTKAQLIEQAQEHCDSSFTAPVDTTKFYTAWNSMKTLIEKDLVYENGRPLRRYLLSDEGWEVAKKIQKVQGGRQGSQENRPVTASAHNPGAFSSENQVNLGNPGNDVNGAEEPERPRKPTPWRGDSHEAEIPGAASLGRRSDKAMVEQLGTFAVSQNRGSVSARVSATDGEFVEILSDSEPQSGPAFGATGTSPDLERGVSEPQLGVLSARKHPESPSDEIREIGTASSFPNITPIRLQPGTFTVQLVLDSREVRAKNDRDYIHDELVKQGVRALVRPLELGDFFWVAKCIEPGLLSRLGEEGDEVALDWIVERKRLDDLIGSIKDGRFQEQKFRFRKLGVKNVVYIIEEFTVSSEKISHFHDAIDSAIGSMQVVDGYFVKKTMKLDDTIRYLARMTGMLKSMYEVRSYAYKVFRPIH